MRQAEEPISKASSCQTVKSPNTIKNKIHLITRLFVLGRQQQASQIAVVLQGGRVGLGNTGGAFQVLLAFCFTRALLSGMIAHAGFSKGLAALAETAAKEQAQDPNGCRARF